MAEYQHQYQILIDIMPEGVFTQRADGTLTDVNAAALAMFGLDRDEFLRRTTLSPEWKAIDEEGTVLSPEQYPSMEALRSGLPVKDAVAGVYNPRKKDFVWLVINAIPLIREGEEKPFQVLVTLHDITKRKRTLESVQAKEELLRLFFEHVPVALAMFDRAMRYLCASRRWWSDYTLDQQELIGKCFYDVFPEFPPAWKEAHRRGLAGEVLRAEGDQFQRLDGSTRWVRWEIHPWRNSKGEVGGILVFTEDITDRKRAEDALRENLRLQDRAQEIAHLGSWELDHVTNELTWSKEVYRIFGLEEQDFEGSYQGFLEAVHPDDRSAVNAAFLDSLREGRDSYEIEHRIVRKSSGEIRHVFEKCEHIRDKTGTRIVRSEGSVHDVTEQKVAEAALQQAKELAEAGTRAKGQFLANMSHELRTPMTGLLGMLDLVLEGELPEEQRGQLSAAKKSAQALLRILNDILDFSKIEAGMLRLLEEPFPLKETLRETMELFDLEAHRKGLALVLDIAPDTPPLVAGDEGRIRQILANLVGNAIKFTERGEVSLRVDAGGAGLNGRQDITFTLTDSGIGISEEVQQTLFHPFSQGDISDTRRHGGTGLGLSISRELTRLMGGTITFSSRHGAGTTFVVTLPLRQIGAAPEVAPQEKAGSATATSDAFHLRLLVAEDNPTIRDLLGMMLKKESLAFDAVDNGKEALELWSQGGYDLILMDMQMPVMDGFETTRAIREQEKACGGHIPIIALTAHAYSSDQQKCLDAGMDAYLAKPFTSRKLFAVIREVQGMIAKS